MTRRLAVLLALCAVPIALVVSACGSDDGAEVRGSTGESALPSNPDSASAPGSASGSGLSLEDAQTGGSGNALVSQGVIAYSDYVAEQVDDTIATTRAFTNAVRAGNLQAARAAYAPSREGWERIEPIAGLIEEIDGAVDSRVDDFAGPGDPAFTGWHADLRKLKSGLESLQVPAAAVALGASDLIEEVSEGKITGEEDRYSKTDLWDFNANVEGAEEVVEVLIPALEDADRELLSRIRAGFEELEASLAPLKRGDGWVLFCR